MPGPRKNLTPLDMQMLGLSYNQGGVINFLGQQPEITAPVRAQSHADSPPVQLAYITDAEKDLLVDANIHGSMDGKPNPGPAGLPSLDDFFNLPGGGVGGGNVDRGEKSRARGSYGIGGGQAVGGGQGGGGGQIFTQTGGGGQQGWTQDDAATAAAIEKANLQKQILEEKARVEAAKEKAEEEKLAEEARIAENKKRGLLAKIGHGEVLDDYIGDTAWLDQYDTGQHKLRRQFDRLYAKYGKSFYDPVTGRMSSQAKVLANYLSGVPVERGGGLGARTDETDAKLIGPTNVEDIPMYDPVTGEYRSLEERQALADAALARENALNQFAGIGGLDAAEGRTSTAAYLKGLDPKQLRLGLNPDQYFQFRQQLMAADPTAGNLLYKKTFPWSSGYAISKLGTPILSMAKGALGIEDKIPAEWADWRANQRVFEDTSMLDSGLMSDPWRYGGDGGGGSQGTGQPPSEGEEGEEGGDEEDAVDLTPTPSPYPVYGTGVAGLDWSQFGPQFGPQYPGHYSHWGSGYANGGIVRLLNKYG